MKYKQLLEKHEIKYDYGSGFGKGWVTLVDKLIIDLIALGWDRRLVQVKEKFGGLRFAISNGTKEMYFLIEEAENQSYKICEACGEPSEKNDKPELTTWLKSMYLVCRQKQRALKSKEDYNGMSLLFNGEAST